MRYVSPYCYGLLLELVYICQSYRIQVTHFLAHIVDNYAVDNIIIHSNNGDKTTSGLSAVMFLVCCSARSATYNQNITRKTHVTIRETVSHRTQPFSQLNFRFYGRHVEFWNHLRNKILHSLIAHTYSGKITKAF